MDLTLFKKSNNLLRGGMLFAVPAVAWFCHVNDSKPPASFSLTVPR